MFSHFHELSNPVIALFQQVALEKVFNFATTNIFETRVSGRMVADMCRAASKVSPLRRLHQLLLEFLLYNVNPRCAGFFFGFFSVSPRRVAQGVCAPLLQYHKSTRCQ